MWIHFIDNTAAEAPLVKGSARTDSADHVCGLTWELIMKRMLWPYFDRVESSANPVDGLSRGRMEGPWERVYRGQLPVQDILQMAEECS